MTTIEQLEQQLAQLKAQQAQAIAAQQKAAAAAAAIFQANPDNWEWKTEKTEPYSLECKRIETKSAIKVARRLKPNLVAEFESTHNLLLPKEPKEWHGMLYHLTTENILYGVGGGWVVLKTPQLCNKEQWQQLLSGVVPEKFLK